MHIHICIYVKTDSHLRKTNQSIQPGQVTPCPWKIQRKPSLTPHIISVVRPEDSSSKRLPIQSNRAWKDLWKGMKKTAWIHVCETFTWSGWPKAICAAQRMWVLLWMRDLSFGFLLNFQTVLFESLVFFFIYSVDKQYLFYPCKAGVSNIRPGCRNHGSIHPVWLLWRM